MSPLTGRNVTAFRIGSEGRCRLSVRNRLYQALWTPDDGSLTQ